MTQRATARSRLLVAFAVALLSGPVECLAATPSLSLSDRTLRVGALSPSPRLRIHGRVREGSGVVVIVSGGSAKERFTVKGRVGPIWATTGRVEVSEAPVLFLSFSDRAVASQLGRAAIDEFVLDESAVVGRMRVEPAEADRPEIRDCYLRLKLEDGTYRSVPGGVSLGRASGGEVPFEADLVWPAVGQPGSYTVAAYECRGGSVAGRAAVTLEVVRGGVAAGLKRLADEHGGLYGALAVGVTMSLGFGIDFVLAGARRRRAIRRVKRAEAIARTDVATH